MNLYFTEIESSEKQVYVDALEASHDIGFAASLDDVGEDAEALCIFINSPITEAFLAKRPRLRFIITRSLSVDHIDVPACRARGIAVANVPHHGEITVAEHTFALLLALSRRIREVQLTPKNGRFSYVDTRGFDLAGKTLGIFGMGRIGQRVAALAQAFGMHVLACDAEPRPEIAQALGFDFVPLDVLLHESHVLTLHAPLLSSTFHILDRVAFAKCRRGVLVINTARGSLIDTLALREALNSGQVGGAGLDVLQDERVMRQPASHIIAADIVQHLRSDALAQDSQDADRIRELQELMLGDEILARANVVFTPHVAFNSVESVARIQQATIKNITDFARGLPVSLGT